VLAGRQWASVNVIAFRNGKSAEASSVDALDHFMEAPRRNGRRAELPRLVADWMVAPYAVGAGLMIDPFAGSGALCAAARRAGMQAIGIDKSP
jgi:hypothetical protein